MIYKIKGYTISKGHVPSLWVMYPIRFVSIQVPSFIKKIFIQTTENIRVKTQF